MHSTTRQFRSPLSAKLFPLTVLALLSAVSLSGQTSFVSFDAPDAGKGEFQGTVASSINLKGVIAGYYFDGSNVQHGFLRQPNGQFTEFSPANLTDVIVYSINNSNQVLGTGSLTVKPYEFVGFVRSATGPLAYFAPAGAIYTEPLSLNDSGEIAGLYQDSAQAFHGFIRSASGAFTVVDDPDATIAKLEGTYATAINDSGQIAGFYDDTSTGTVRGFIRDQFGNFTNFDPVPGGAVGINLWSMNLSGEVCGEYWGNDQIPHGFLRDASGTVTDFSLPGSVLTDPTSINDSGVIVGEWQNSAEFTLGFERDGSGDLTPFAAPGSNYGTSPAGINNNGRITGSWEDTNYVAHGFVK